MGLYKYISFSNLKHLLDGTIRFTQPKAFNDPFELLPEIHLIDDINGFSLDVTAPPREGSPARLADDFESKKCNDIAARDVLNAVNDLIGILCLSRNSNSLLMWSHYADEYKGAGLCCVIKFRDRANPFRLFLSQYDKFQAYLTQ